MGAWGGRLFLDNPMYFLYYLIERTSMSVVWIGEQEVYRMIPQNNRVKFVRRGTLKAVWHLLTSKVWICTHSHNMDLTGLPIPWGVKCINLWHGIPIKRVGDLRVSSQEGHPDKSRFSRRVYNAISFFPREWLAVSSEKMVDIMVDGYPRQFCRDKIVRSGTPRNDYIIRNRCDMMRKVELKRKYGQILGFDSKKKVVLYLPTWRERSKTLFSFFGLPAECQAEWKNLLDREDAVLVEKYHHASFERLPPPQSSQCSCVVMVEQERLVNAQEMLLMADLLISDYSGAYIDFSLLRRPIIHFVYDCEEYSKNDSGFAYELDDVLAGTKVSSLPELEKEVVRQLQNPEFSPKDGLNDVVAYEQGIASKLLVEFITNNRILSHGVDR